MRYFREFCLLLPFLTLLAVLSNQPATAQDRVALVIGNGAYANASQLINPPNDAADMAATLRDLGFDVVAATNVDKVSFDNKVREFAGRLRLAHTALFFYAGHGMQVAGKNYAVPIDARLESAADLQVETIDIDRVLAVMQADESRVNLVFLDACRDNPLTRSFARALPATRAVAVGSGLTAVNAGRGTLIAFATAPNKVALDGRGRNSPFTAALLKHISTPGLDIAFVMRRVTADVEAASDGSQVPWVHASLTTDVMLKPGSGTAAWPPVSAGTPPTSTDEITWSLLKDTKDVEQLRRFLRQFPDSARKNEVEARIASLGQPGGPPSIGQSAPATTVNIEPPHEPLPSEAPVDEAVLRLVETHPFFANAPAIRIGSYATSMVLNMTWSGGRGKTTANEDDSIQWLRRGIDKTIGTSSSESGPRSMDSQMTTVTAANGLITLSFKQVNANSEKLILSRKTVQINDIKGKIFPVAVGNHFSYDLIQKWRNPHVSGEETITTACDVLLEQKASIFHINLTGNAYVANCVTRKVDRKLKMITDQRSAKVFFESLGYWLEIDPIIRDERMAENIYRSSGAGSTAMTNKYKTVLKSITQIR
jgi:uncharacterized caspase-like protein